MSWVLSIVGALLGALTSRGDLFGLLGGGLIGLLWARMAGLQQEVGRLEERLRQESAVRATALRALGSASPAPASASLGPEATATAEAVASAAEVERPEVESVEVESVEVESVEVESVEVESAAPEVPSALAEDLTPPLDERAPEPPTVIAALAAAPADAAVESAVHAAAPKVVIRPPRPVWGADALQGEGPANAPFAPGPIENGIAWLKRWFSEGNVPVKIGMLVLFFGVGALLKYAADQGMFSVSIEARLALVGTAAVAGLWFGWHKRDSSRQFSLALQGGALGILLLTTFAAYRLYGVLPATPAFGLVLLLVAASGLLAVLQNSMALAVLGSVGGFLAPVLLSTGQGSHVALFSYYTVLNLAIFAVAWVRSWRPLNLVGFVFTFGIASIWGANYYQPEFFASTEPFLVGFFLMYVGIGYLFATRPSQRRRGFVDGTLLFGTPLVAAGLQAGLLADDDIALSMSALAAAALYTLLGWRTRGREGLQTLSLSYASLALGFATIAVPLALDADVTAQVWAIEGTAVLWLGLRQQRTSQRVAGLLLQTLALCAWAIALVDFHHHDAQALTNAVFVGGVLLAIALGTSSWLLERYGSGDFWANAALLPALGVWAVTGIHEVDAFAPHSQQREAFLLWCALSLVLSGVLRWRLEWLRISVLAVLGMAAGLLIAFSRWEERVLVEWGVYAWPLWIAAALFALRTLAEPRSRALSWTHVMFLAAVSMLAGTELHTRLATALDVGHGWRLLAAFAPLAGLLWASLRERSWVGWPVREDFDDYRLLWWLPATTVLALVWIIGLYSAGSAQPLPYLSLLNPLELLQIAIMLLGYRIARVLAVETDLRRGALAIAGFVWISTVTLRGVHHYGGESWDMTLWGSMLAQTSLTVVWSVLGVAAWIYGSRRGSRPIWMAGAVLMGIVLAKLMVVDRQHMGNIPGIVSFLAVGLLLTVVGYFAPSPPRAAVAAPEENA